MTVLPITIYRRASGPWVAIATVATWSIADAVGNMLSASGDAVRAICGAVSVDYANGERERGAA